MLEPALNLDIFISLGSVWLSVQESNPLITFAPVIGYWALYFNMLFLSTRIGDTSPVVLSNSAIQLIWDLKVKSALFSKEEPLDKVIAVWLDIAVTVTLPAIPLK